MRKTAAELQAKITLERLKNHTEAKINTQAKITLASSEIKLKT